MDIDTSIASIGNLSLESSGYKSIKQNTSNGFESFFDAALDLYNETNIYQLKAEQMQVDYVTGKTDDIIGLNMAQSMASSSLQFTTQVTSKILAAYQEIMRMQL